MSHDDNKRTAALAEHVQSAPHEFGAYALALVIWNDRHRRQSHPSHSPRPALGHHRSEEDVPNHAIVDSDQRQSVCARQAQLVDEIGFRRLFERQLVDTPNLGNVFRPFLANRDHGCPFYANARSTPRRSGSKAIEVVLISNKELSRNTKRSTHTLRVINRNTYRKAMLSHSLDGPITGSGIVTNLHRITAYADQ